MAYGILDSFGDPTTQGLLALSAGLLQAGGPSRMPTSFGAALGSGVMQGMGAYNAAGQLQLKSALEREQIKQLQEANAMALLRQNAITQAQNANGPGALAAPTGPTDTSGMSPASSQAMFGTPQYASEPAAPAPASAGYFNPQTLFKQGKLYADVGLPGGVEMMNAALSHDPALKPPTVLRAEGIALDPVTHRPLFQAPKDGVQIQWGPNGPQATSIPNYSSLIAQNAQAEAGAKESVKPFMVQNASGAMVPTFPGQMSGFPRIPGISAPMGATAAPTGAPSAPPYAGAPTMAQPPQLPQPAAAPAMPQQAPQPQAPRIAPPAKQDVWASIPKMPVPQGMGQSTYNKVLAEKTAGAVDELSTKYGAQAKIANERSVFTEQALQHLDQATTGPGALGIAEVQNFLTSRLGISADTLAKAAGGDSSATLVLNKDLLNAATQTAKANYGARMTQSEVMMQIKQGAPNADMTKAAIQYLLKTDQARAQYEVQQANDLGRYIQAGGDPHRFEAWYAHAFPMSGMLKGVAPISAPSAAPGIPKGVTVRRVGGP